MKDDNCIFCKLANGDIPTNTIYEDEKYRVILDLGPATRGHALILPKDHYCDLYELPDEVCGEVMKLAKRMAARMTERLQCSGFNLVQNNGESAGQTVRHLSLIHIFCFLKGWKCGRFPGRKKLRITAFFFLHCLSLPGAYYIAFRIGI